MSVSGGAWLARASMCGSSIRQAGQPAGSCQSREGAGELAGGLVPGVVDRLGAAVGVARVGGAGHGLHQPVHGQGAGVGGEHAVGGQAADRAQQRGRVGQPVQQVAGDASGAYQARIRSTCPASGSPASRSKVTCQIRAMVRAASPPSAAAWYMAAG